MSWWNPFSWFEDDDPDEFDEAELGEWDFDDPNDPRNYHGFGDDDYDGTSAEDLEMWDADLEDRKRRYLEGD